METYRYALALTSQFYFCGIPFRLDTSPKCTLNCLYCFAMSRGGRRTSLDLIASPKKIYNSFFRVFNSDNQNLDIVGEFLKDKKPLHFGGMSDPFSNDLTSPVSMELLRIIDEFDYPTVLSTKNSKVLLMDETISLLKKIKYLALQISVSSSQHLSSITEPNVPSVNDRIKAFQLLSSEGIYTIARVQPLFPGDIDEVSSELIPMLANAGVKHVVVEFLKLPLEVNISNVADLFNKTGWNGLEYYQKHLAIRTGREWVLPAPYKWELLQPVIDAIHKYGMTFGAGDYGLNHLSDTDCCCGISDIPGFSNYFRATIPSFISKSAGNYLLFKDMSNIDVPKKSIRMYMNSQCRPKDTYSLIDFIRWKWNHPGTENAPDTFLGVLWNGEYDGDNNCVYVKEEEYKQ